MTEDNVFSDFIGKRVKVPYKDGIGNKVARGELLEARNGFVKISGKLGVIIINQDSIIRMGLESDQNI